MTDNEITINLLSEIFRRLIEIGLPENYESSWGDFEYIPGSIDSIPVQAHWIDPESFHKVARIDLLFVKYLSDSSADWKIRDCSAVEFEASWTAWEG